MKRIIERVTYNSDTGKLLGSYSNNKPYNDFNYQSETLYKTRKGGLYFLYLEGGPLSSYSETNSDGSIGYGEHIYAINEHTAKKWHLCRVMDDEAYEKVFKEKKPKEFVVNRGDSEELLAWYDLIGETLNEVFEHFVYRDRQE